LADRFYVIDELLKKVLFYLSNMVRPPSSLFSLVTGCYVKLSQNSRARNGIRRYTPFLLFDGTFSRLYAEDPVAANNRIQLLQNLDN
jgi:CCR4-NOT transcription complex subunit 9